MENLTATYSPEDNKLRLYAGGRLDPETYAKVKAEGFRWAPKQDLFVAPAWTPSRHDLMVEMCGTVGDEDTSLEDRQEERAERFEGYQENRANDAENAHAAVSAITDNIPMGQPILVGHHSEKHARRDAQKIENGMRKAVKMWETSEYWKTRAAGALRHAKYKERADVRARRIKKLQAERRKYYKYVKESMDLIKIWNAKELTYQRAVDICNYKCHVSACFTLEAYPREAPISQYEGSQSLWSALNDGIINEQKAREISIRTNERTIKHYSRWVQHTDLRIEYETTLLGEQGSLELIAKKPRPKQLPLLNYSAPGGIETKSRWSKDSTTFPQKEMTKAEYSKIYSENRYCLEVDGSHRVRFYSSYRSGSLDRYVVFLTDSKVHAKPEKEAVTA